MFVLDTNVVSELRKVRAGKADLHVARWADSVEAECLYLSAITVLELEIGVLQIARLHVPNPGAERDALIAATALVHGMTVVTRNEDDFKAACVPILNPWNAAS